MEKPNTRQNSSKTALPTRNPEPATLRYHDELPSSSTPELPELPPLYLQRKGTRVPVLQRNSTPVLQRNSTPVLPPLYTPEDESELELLSPLPPPSPLLDGYSPDTNEIELLEWEAKHGRPDRKKLAEMMGIVPNDKKGTIRIRGIVRSYIRRYCDMTKVFDEYPYRHFMLPLITKTTLYLNKEHFVDRPWTKSVTQHVIKAIFTDDLRNAKTKAKNDAKREFEWHEMELEFRMRENPFAKRQKRLDEMAKTWKEAATSAHPEVETPDEPSTPGPMARDETVETSPGETTSSHLAFQAARNPSTLGPMAAEPLKKTDSSKRTDTPNAALGVPKASKPSATVGSSKNKRAGKIKRMKFILKHNGSSRMFNLLPDATWDILADVITALIEDVDLCELGVFLQYLPVVVFDEDDGSEWKDLNGDDDLRMAVRSHRSGVYVRLDPKAYSDVLQEQLDEAA
jgi:hypothetical protein